MIIIVCSILCKTADVINILMHTKFMVSIDRNLKYLVKISDLAIVYGFMNVTSANHISSYILKMLRLCLT